MAVMTESKMTEFGQYLYALMLARGIEYKGDLVDMLTERGYSMTRSRLSNYLSSQRQVPWIFVRCVEELLDLSQAERKKLEKLHLDEYVKQHTGLTDVQEEILTRFRSSRER